VAWSRRWTERGRVGLLRLDRRLGDGDRGSATLEFLAVGLLLLVPTVYLVIVLAQLQAASFAVEGATRQATRVYVQAPDEGEARAAALRAVEVALADHGLEGLRSSVEMSCRPDPADCLSRRGFVTIRVAVQLPLPLLPPVIDAELPAGVPVEAVSTEQVSRFWSGG